jgi:two-component system phosphate regulon sensor histidine kinase PhoR
MHDVTKIKKLEKIRTDFVTNVTHELRTPLTSIKGFVETLKEGAIDDPKTRGRFIDIIGAEAERLERLIEDILLLSEIEGGKSPSMIGELLDVEKVIEEEILPIFGQQAARKEIVLKTFFEDHLPTLHMDKDRFKQMMINLVDNAVKFTENGGQVTVSAYRNQQSMVLKVKDTGIGIPVEHHERIFERFYRIDSGRSRKEGGTGLGLAIVKHIVLSANGSVEVNSRPGAGTEFKIEIPLQGEE